jgi:hypothetical protein
MEVNNIHRGKPEGKRPLERPMRGWENDNNSFIQQEVPRRTNRLLSLVRHGPH